MKSAPREQVAVMGLGRSGQGDDGIGPAALRGLRADFRPRADVLYLDGDLEDFTPESVLGQVCGLIMVGRVHVPGPPGILKVIRGPEIVSMACSLQMSGRASTFLAPLARRELLTQAPEEWVLIGVNSDHGSGSDGMAPAVQLAVGPAVLAVEVELARMGRPLTRLQRQFAFRDPWVRGWTPRAYGAR